MPLPDSFEVLRDCRALYLRQLGALLQEGGALSGPAVQAVQRGAGEWFDEVLASRHRGSFEEEADGLTSSRITLVGHDDLELNIRLDNLSARLFESTGDKLWKTHLRFVTLLKRTDLPKANNPVGPKGIRQGLTEMFAAAGAIALDKKLDLLDKLETNLLQHLPALYAAINDFLDRAGVDAAQPTIVTSQDTARKPAAETAPGISENLLLALQQSLLAQVPGLAQPAGESAGSAGAAASLLNQAVMERLLTRLNDLERQLPPPASYHPERSNSLESLIPGLFQEDRDTTPAPRPLLKSGELGLPAHAPEGVAIDTLALIFEAIFADPKLPDALKSVISSLQITMLKIAMQDAAFFTDPVHPARLLLDRMGQAMLGLPVDVAARHPTCTRLFAIATELRSRFTGDVAVFAAATAEVDKLIADRQAEIRGAAQTYLPLLNQLDRRDQAAAEASRALDRLNQPGLPEAIRAFLDLPWRRVLQSVWLEEGPDSSQWKSHVDLIGELLWTFEPKPGAEGRAELAKRLPEILKRLKAGMERIALSPEAQADFLDTCFSLQTRAMRSTQPSAVPDAGSAQMLAADSLQHIDDTPVVGEIESSGLLLRTLDFAGYRPGPSRALPCKTGDWLEIEIAEGQTGTACLCHLSAISHRALLCNPDASIALAIHPSILDKQFREGRARNCSSLSLFETAAARALGQNSGN